MTIVGGCALRTELKQTVLSSWYVKTMGVSRAFASRWKLGQITKIVVKNDVNFYLPL